MLRCMRRSLLATAVLGSLLLGLTACGSLASLDLDDEDRRPPDPSPIPSGAQQVQVAITPDHVTTLTPRHRTSR